MQTNQQFNAVSANKLTAVIQMISKNTVLFERQYIRSN